MLFQIDVLPTLTPSRIIQVFIFQLGGGIIYLFIAILILTRDRKRLNFLLSGFFIFVFIGVIFNVIYALITNILIATIMSYITVFFLFSAPVFLVVFNLVILKSEKIITTPKQILIIAGYFALMLLILLIPDAIIIEASNNYIPRWNFLLFLSLSILIVVYGTIPFMITSFRISKKFEDKLLKKKWNYYMYASPFYTINAVMVGLCNHINDPDLRLIWNIISLGLYLMAYAVYYGVGRQISKE